MQLALDDTTALKECSLHPALWANLSLFKPLVASFLLLIAECIPNWYIVNTTEI